MIMPLLSVKNVDASIAFYEKLGFQKQLSFPGPDGVTTFGIVVLGDNHIGIGLDTELTIKGSYAPGVEFMIYIPKDGQNIDAHHAQTVANGVTITEALGTAYWGDRTYKVHDPDGYVIVMAQELEPVDMERAGAVMRGEASSEKTN